MEPNNFREARQAINKLCKDIFELIEDKQLDASKACFQEAAVQLDSLRPHAEGEIQERSVKNLGLKMNALSNHIDKLKPAKGSANKAGKKIAKPSLVWDEEIVGQLSTNFLKKVFTNMGNDVESKVCFGTTGKGIRPNYQIEFSNHDIANFSGSGHIALKKPPAAGAKKISQPFSYTLIDSILHKK